MANKDYYSTLGIDRNASDEEIKKAFKKLAMQLHPDKQQGKSDAEKKAAEERFKDVNEAYSVLGDKEKREQYDLYGTVGGMNMDGGFSSGGDFADMFRHMHSGFGFGFRDDIEDMFGGRQATHKPVIKGSDIRIRVEYTLEEAYKGATKTVRYNRQTLCSECNGKGSKTGNPSTCHHCHGTGVVMETEHLNPFQTISRTTTCRHCGGTGVLISDPCRKCNGIGLETSTTTVDIKIPKGVVNGTVAQMDGMGNMAIRGDGISGNLIIHFIQKKHDVFVQPDGTPDLACKKNVGVLDCITGCEETVTCIDGSKAKITIPSGTKDGAVITVKGKGMPYQANGSHKLWNHTEYGDMLVYVSQVMPLTLTKGELNTIGELKTSKNFKK